MTRPVPEPMARVSPALRAASLPFLRLACLALALAAVLGSPLARAAAPAEDGLYAEFVTSKGEFTCRLEYTKVPRTVANFIVLAEGTRDWIDFTTARIVQGRYFDGITFHRVIPGFMIQSGSRNALGTDGPGYRFKDEFHETLRHSKAGTLSMANSGVDSNGAQFFVTVTNTPWLDNKHSVFGEVVQGLDLVHEISKVPRNAGDKPLEPIVLQTIRIVRNGAAAQAFDPAKVSPPLPDVGVVPTGILLTTNKLLLPLQARPGHSLHAFFGTNLVQWSIQSFHFTNAIPDLDASGLRGRRELFFRILDGGQN